MSQTPPKKQQDTDEDEVLGKAYDPRIVGRTWVYVQPYRMHMVASVGLMVLIAGANLAQPYLTKLAIDHIEAVATQTAAGRAIVPGDFTLLTVVALVYVACALASW